MSRRTHPRRRSRLPFITLVIAILLIGSIIIPATSFTTARVDRGSSVDVVSDAEGMHTLDIASNVSIGQTSRLVTITNNIGVDVSIEVQLRSDSNEKGDLVVGNKTHGDVATFSLPAGQSTVVDIRIPDDGTLDGEVVYFHVNASGNGVTVTSPNRKTSINT